MSADNCDSNLLARCIVSRETYKEGCAKAKKIISPLMASTGIDEDHPVLKSFSQIIEDGYDDAIKIYEEFINKNYSSEEIFDTYKFLKLNEILISRLKDINLATSQIFENLMQEKISKVIEDYEQQNENDEDDLL